MSVSVAMDDPFDDNKHNTTFRGAGPPGARFYVNVSSINRLTGAVSNWTTDVVTVPSTAVIGDGDNADVLLQGFSTQSLPSIAPAAVERKYESSKTRFSTKLYKPPPQNRSGDFF